MVTRFKNGNINVRLDAIGADDARAYEAMVMELDAVDTYPVGDEFCLGNSAMGMHFYSYYSDRIYVFNMADLDVLKAGKTVKLFACVPDEYDREIIGAQGR